MSHCRRELCNRVRKEPVLKVQNSDRTLYGLFFVNRGVGEKTATVDDKKNLALLMGNLLHGKK